MDPNQTDPLLQHFRWSNLPIVVQPVAKLFGHLAADLVRTLPQTSERSEALRKLLESKDCAVRAAIPDMVVTVDDLA